MLCELYVSKAITKNKPTNTDPREQERSLVKSLRGSRIPPISMEFTANIRVFKDVQRRKSPFLILNIQARREGIGRGAYGQGCPDCKLGLNLNYRGLALSSCPRPAFILKTKE